MQNSAEINYCINSEHGVNNIFVSYADKNWYYAVTWLLVEKWSHYEQWSLGNSFEYNIIIDEHYLTNINGWHW